MPARQASDPFFARIIRLVVGLLMNAGYLALAAWGWGGWSSFLAHPARVAAAALLLALTVGVTLAPSPGGRSEQVSSTDRWVMPIGLMLGLLLAWLPPYAEAHNWPSLPDNEALRWGGVTLMAFGGVLRVVAIWRLGARFSGRVELQQGHRLETGGIYSVIRHPAYLGGLVLLLGWCLVFRSLAGLPLVVGMTLVLLARIQDEERLLGEVFGNEYRNYQRCTRRLVPWVY